MGPNLANLLEPVVLVAPDLSPSATALLDRSKVLGFATDRGGLTGHTAIVARKLRIPAVVGLGDASKELQTGDHVLIDGHDGVLVLSPTDATLFRYGQIRERREALEVRLQAVRDLPAVTLDGVKVGLAANIDEPSEVASVRESGAHGVGLFRTEFLFLNSEVPPDEDRQYAAYRTVAESLTPAPVVIRTLDLGGDKLVDPNQAEEQNPFLGWRAIRISLSRPDMFRVQLRAVLRASAHGRLRLMFPMISGLEELLDAKALLEECRSDLSRQGIAHDPGMQVGMMVEVPSAALLASEFAPHVDFFSLGTNDLTQYTLAVDRLNPRVAPLHSPAHPAVIRLIHATVRSAREHRRWVGVCGEMAGDPALIPLLVGLGVDELSVTPALIPAAKHLLRRLRRSEAVAMAERALSCSKASEVLQLSRSLARSVAPELFSGGE
jgi:phosphotransferase system enzyme I (PtsI)